MLITIITCTCMLLIINNNNNNYYFNSLVIGSDYGLSIIDTKQNICLKTLTHLESILCKLRPLPFNNPLPHPFNHPLPHLFNYHALFRYIRPI